MATAAKKYIAYTDMGAGSGAFVDPDDHGGEDSDNFKYLLDHRVIVPLGDPDAAIAMGDGGNVDAQSELEAKAREEEIANLKAKIAELEQNQKDASVDDAQRADEAEMKTERAKDDNKSSSTPTPPARSSAPTGVQTTTQTSTKPVS